MVGASGTFRAAPREPLANSPVDCFYVYPTVSHQQTVNANLKIDPEERDVAVAQASRFSSACRMYAPMYPQLTLHAIFTPGAINLVSAATAYAGVLTAFRDYLARYNHGRGIVFIGHSQGAAVLIALLRNEVDKQPTLRRRTGPRWGLHIYDVQLALGDLVRLVSAEAAAYRRPAGRR